jgi:hypothetical protein
MRQVSAVFIIIGGIGAALASPAWAGAKLEPIAPQVSVNRGQGYKLVTASTEVSAGDQVMVGPGGRGRIVYADGCVVDAYPGRVVAVPAKCYQPMRAGLECDPATDPKCLAPPVARTPWWLIGGIAAGIGVGICAASGCFNHEEHHRKSP